MVMQSKLKSPDRRVALTALRDLLAERIEAAEPKETVPLARQLADVMRELDGMKPAEESRTDDLAAKRKKRRASVSARAVEPVVGGEGSG